ncbi:CoA-transferase [Nitratireductor indicus C115]|uniref:CoA-transferase n=1 Tax=Nitratireductor indicus C115 TaxID=1231190 RepID=K2P296_9HYPH|nr:CoA transferase [Nitratireductor indicus]EKF44229.1 CoA-transferase [Nitratireductor indicus C115]SFQ25744.1 Crotonobetainyl-CoA:carnitine CoA-transferase CaiB [Nitratireductor indicus]
MADAATGNTGPLKGLRVLDISTVIAGPMAAGLLGDFGADVLKIEKPRSGDGLRQLRPHKGDVSLWSKVVNRNKKAITLDLRLAEGKALFKQLLEETDVLIENFRPGTLERWGLGPDELWKVNPKLTILRVSAFGQKGPYASKPGFARIADAMSGFLSLCGPGDGAPVHVGYPIADSVTGLFGVFGLLMALFERQANPQAPGQVVAVSLFESMFRVMDFLAIEYDQLGEVRGRHGNRNPYAAPGNIYRTRDGKWCTLAASTQSVFERLMRVIGRPELITDSRFTDNRARLANVELLDGIVADWFAAHDADMACALLDRHSVSAARVFDIKDIFEDAHVAETGSIVSVEDDELGTVRMQNVTPAFSRTPGRVASAGPSIGQHNLAIFGERLGLSPEEIATLSERGVI